MIVETDNYLSFEVTFSVCDREEGFNDDIRFAMRESGPPTARILRSDECGLLLTPNQAERLAEALLQAAQESRATGNRERRTSRFRFGSTMTTLAKAFIELAGYLENARFDDPDEEQGVEELVEWCLVEASPEERDALSKVARERAREEAANGSAPQIIEFCERFAARAESQQAHE